jgi:subtilisin
MGRFSQFPSHAEAAEALHKGDGGGIRVAVLDSGVDLAHPELRGVRLVDDLAFDEAGGRRFSGRGTDAHGHGTAMAALVLRAAPRAQVGSFRVLGADGGAGPRAVRDAAVAAVSRDYNILLCAFGSVAVAESMPLFKEWVDGAYARGVHVVCPCNNLFFRVPEWPGAFPSVVTVNMAETASGDLFFRQDPRGGHLVEFAARGVDIEVPWKDGGTAVKTGSSFAAAHAAGMLAKLLSVFPAMKPPVAKSLLQEIAEPWHDRLAVRNA